MQLIKNSTPISKNRGRHALQEGLNPSCAKIQIDLLKTVTTKLRFVYRFSIGKSGLDTPHIYMVLAMQLIKNSTPISKNRGRHALQEGLNPSCATVLPDILKTVTTKLRFV